MRYKDILCESALSDLEQHLPNHIRHGHSAVDDLMHKIARRHNLTTDALHMLFKRKHTHSPHDLLKDKLHEEGEEVGAEEQIREFIQWAIDKLHIQKPYPSFTLSNDTTEAQDNHHTGANAPDDNTIWVYVKNRNLVDIFRTIFHELVHTRQGQLGMIKPGQSYPGSPIESMADMLAGKYIKIYGEEHHEIFQ